MKDLLLTELEQDLPTTAEDVAALRRLRHPQLGENLLPRLQELAPPDFLPPPPPRRTPSEGWEPFTL